ncbi:MAG: hypothetical protein QXK37_05525 [Candidatus Woesearchaeota archaeon]
MKISITDTLYVLRSNVGGLEHCADYIVSAVRQADYLWEEIVKKAVKIKELNKKPVEIEELSLLKNNGSFSVSLKYHYVGMDKVEFLQMPLKDYLLLT